ncbi:ABC transporter permease, partial [Thermodesulfovibrionales bacterium]|nr:ABC transporter permease [Thermodesulfovibrionales bacterium]
HDPIEQNLEHRLLSPNTEYLLGTDNLGRCILSRLIHGTSVSLQIGIMVVGIAAFVGVTLGLVAGYRGGLIDELIMRIVDILLAFPGIILALVIAGILGPSLFNVMLALAVVGWTSYARVVRGAVLSVKEKEFVEAAQALGAGEARIMFRHILPNVMAPVIVMATLGMAHVILAAAALGFLGLGAQPPTPEWGSMLNDGRAFMRTAPHLTIFPGLAIMVTVLAFNFLGDGLRDALDPRLKGMMR